MTQWVTGRCLRRLGSLAVAIAATAAAAAAAESYRLVEGWGALPAGQEWGEALSRPWCKCWFYATAGRNS